MDPFGEIKRKLDRMMGDFFMRIDSKLYPTRGMLRKGIEEYTREVIRTTRSDMTSGWIDIKDSKPVTSRYRSEWIIVYMEEIDTVTEAIFDDFMGRKDGLLMVDDYCGMEHLVTHWMHIRKPDNRMPDKRLSKIQKEKLEKEINKHKSIRDYGITGTED